MAKKILARVLAALPHLSASCNDLIEGPADHLKRMADSGQVDTDPAAVAYAKSIGARVVSLTDEGLLPAQELAGDAAGKPAASPASSPAPKADSNA
jgi:hypothetical protein